MFTNLYDNMEKDYKDTGNKSLVCMWSGGCDSTLVLHQLLTTLKETGDKRTVTTFSFCHAQLGEPKMDAELTARMSYTAFAKKSELPLGLNKVIAIDRHNISATTGSCPQPALWVSHVIPYIEDNSILFLGYHRGDDFWSYGVFNPWAQAFIGLSRLFNKKIECRTPLHWASKVEIIRQLKTANIYDHTWYCEGCQSNGKPCGNCTPCQTHLMADLYLKHTENKAMTTQFVDSDRTVDLPNISSLTSADVANAK